MKSYTEKEAEAYLNKITEEEHKDMWKVLNHFEIRAENETILGIQHRMLVAQYYHNKALSALRTRDLVLNAYNGEEGDY